MIYAMSDIHGQYELFRNLMEQITLGKDDILYVLGDVVTGAGFHEDLEIYDGKS